MVNTSKNYLFNKAPKLIQLFGDKTKKLESSEHIIEFPGGAVEVARTSDGNYWAHIIINRGEVLDDCDGLCSKKGTVIGSRIDRSTGKIEELEDFEDIRQIAVLVKTEDS
jgi:hypothetical protein